jgi:hypothetical protein
MLAVGLAATTLLLVASPGEAKRAPARPVPISYVAPTNPAHQAVYESLKTSRVLERARDFFRIIPMAKPFGLKLAGCDGEINAWYEPEDRTITVCYEYIVEQQRIAPKTATPAGVTADDVLVGTTLEVFLHEAGHALFDIFKIPVLGREEDAADQLAAYTLLQLGDDIARRTIGGLAFMFATEAKTGPSDMTAFANEHGLPAQRFYNLLCIAYGAKPKLFADVVEKGHLPKDRAEQCATEYAQVSYAVSTLLGPHMDKAAAKKLRAEFKTRKMSDRPGAMR